MSSQRASDKIINDPSLSWAALGIWTYLFCQPRDGLPTVEEILELGRGADAEVRNALHDLQLRGFFQMGA